MPAVSGRIRRDLLAAASAAWLLAACGSAEDETARGAASDAVPTAERAVNAINAARASARDCGASRFAAAGPIGWDARVAEAAFGHARWLQQNNAFGHAGADDSTVGQRLGAIGYAWSRAGENLAAGQPALEQVMQAWLDSPGHCAILMDPLFVHAALAMVPGVSGNTYRTYWVMVLASPR
jgi:uncharacterized protein YkwD